MNQSINLSVDVQSSPIFRRRSDQSSAEIGRTQILTDKPSGLCLSDDDEMDCAALAVSVDPCSSSSSTKENEENVEQTCSTSDPVSALAIPPQLIRDALYFRNLIRREETRLTDLCNKWDHLLHDDIPEGETGSVRTVIGQAHLLQRERFAQFAGLVDQFENKSGEKEITPTDLEGFWEMIYLQVCFAI